MNALITYLSPVWGWVILWWLIFNGALFAFTNGVAGGILTGWFQELWGKLDSWKELIGWM